MNKKITLLLFLTIAISFCTPKANLYAMKKETNVEKTNIPKKISSSAQTSPIFSSPSTPGSESNNNKKLSWWKQTLIKGVILAGINIVLGDILREILSFAKSNEVKEREKIESLLSINKALKNNMEYIRTKFRRSKTIKEMEQKFINACSKIMDLHMKYLQKYGNKGKKGTKS